MSCTGALTTWAGGGGNSFSSPIMAGIQAVINQALGTNNVGNPIRSTTRSAKTNTTGSGSTSACNSIDRALTPACSFNDITQGDIMVPAGAHSTAIRVEGVFGLLSTSNTSYAASLSRPPRVGILRPESVR